MLRALPFVVLLTLGTGCVIHTAGTATVRVHDQYVAPSYVVVSAPPPPLVAAVTPGYQPSHDAIWIEGYWDWQGSGWVWVEGHWETSRPGQEWEHGVCVVVEGGGYQYHPGHWRPRDVAPPPIYRAEGTVQIHVGTSRVRRVPPSQIGHTPTVVVAAGPSRGPSANVTVRPATVVVQPSHPTVVVQPSHPTVVVQPNRPTTTVTVQPEPRPATVTVQPSRPTTTVTVRPEPRPTVVQPSRPTTTVTVQPSQPVRPSTTVTVQPEPRPNQPTRPSVQVQPTTVAPNTNVRPSVQAQPTTVAPNTNVRPTVQAQPTTVAPNTNVRPTVQAQPTTVAPNTNVRPTTPTTTVVTTPNNPVRPNPVVTTPRPTVTQGQVQCAPVISRVPQNGFLVLRGRGLGSVSAVTIGSQSAAIATRTDEEVRARLMGLSGGGAVSIIVGGQTYSCGRVDITGP